MSIPMYHDLFPYVLQVLQDGNMKQLRTLRGDIALILDLTDLEMRELLPSKTQTVFDNRCNWASYYLFRAGILNKPKRSWYQLSTEGKKHISEHGFSITLKDLERYESFRQFTKPSDKSVPVIPEPLEIDTLTPEDRINRAMDELTQQLADEILSEVMNMSARFFEKLVLDLLFRMGYGGQQSNSIIQTPYTNDDGIDGLIREDELGLDFIYVQAKRWKNTITQPDIQQFAGALSGQGARKGVFITTSSFSTKAMEYAKRHLASNIVLVDGKRLTELMIAYGVGLTVTYEYKLQKIDKDYYDEGE